MREKRKRTKPWMVYLTVCLIVFIVAMCFGYFIVSSNSISIGNFVKNAFKQDITSSGSSVEISTIESNSSNQLDENSSQAISNVETTNTFLAEQENTDISFDRTLFIGDELVASLKNTDDLSSIKLLSDSKLTPINIDSEKIFPTSNGKATLFDSFQYYNPDQIYIVFSASVLSGADENEILEGYQNLIDELQAVYAEVPIVVQLIMPVTEAYSENYSDRSNQEISSLNQSLVDFYEKKENVYLLDIPIELKNKDNGLSTDYSDDGYRLTEEGYEKWATYIVSHPVVEEGN